MRASLLFAVLFAAGLALPSTRSSAQATPASGFAAPKLEALDDAITAAIAQHTTPGAVLWLERGPHRYHHAYGRRAVEPRTEEMTEDTVFDAASLTKVLATTPAVMLLVERDRIRLDEPLKTYLPEFTGEGRDALRVRHLLTHTSGLRPGLGASGDWTGYTAGIRHALDERPEYPPDTRFRYSDINFILLGEVVRRVGGQSLDRFCAHELYEPLGMADTGFLPPTNRLDRIAPTTRDGSSGRFLRGVVHDPTARRMGGVAGHAGLFTTVADTARFCRMMLAGGTLEGVRVLQSETVRRMTRVQSPPALAESRRGLGWDIDSAYAGPRGDVFPVGSYGHSGWTGTSLWIDPFSASFVILFSNRNHPTEDGNVLPLRRRVGTLAAEAIVDFDFSNVPGALPRQPAKTTPTPPSATPTTNPGAGPAKRGGAGAGAGAAGPLPAPNASATPVRNGIDSLAARGYAPVKRLRLGLITNHTGTDAARNPTIDLLKNAPEVDLRALFSPEHGIRGQADENIADSTDARTGLPVYSLYGETRRPTAAQLANLDALVFDIQDIGCRFYTYISTMGLSLEAAAQHHLKYFVLDRVNPINGVTVEGPVRGGTNHSFVAFHTLPLRHGMTVGELARMMNAERDWNADLTVIPVEGWKRAQWFDETGLPWINTSPNMRNLGEAILYPGVGLLESAVSVGRGTDTPFEVVGAPYIDDVRWAAALNAAGVSGIRFVPVRFTPRASVFKDRDCGGVYLLVTDRNACPVVDVGLTMALTLQRLYPREFAWDKLGPLLAHGGTLEAIRSGRPLAEIKAGWERDLAGFRARREKYLLY